MSQVARQRDRKGQLKETADTANFASLDVEFLIMHTSCARIACDNLKYIHTHEPVCRLLSLIHLLMDFFLDESNCWQ